MSQIIKYDSPEIYINLKTFVVKAKFIDNTGEIGEVELKGSLGEDVEKVDTRIPYIWDVVPFVNGKVYGMTECLLTIEDINESDKKLKWELNKAVKEWDR